MTVITLARGLERMHVTHVDLGSLRLHHGYGWVVLGIHHYPAKRVA